MGQAIDKERFDTADHERFGRRLHDSLVALRELLERPHFGVGTRTLGAELEMFLVDKDGEAVARSTQVMKQADHPAVTLELNRFNLEINASPLPLEGKPFEALSAQLEALLATLRSAAASHGARLALIGILPTLTQEQLGRDAMTRKSRYRALSAGILEARQGPLHVRIDGDDPLELDWDEVTLQGANTSFQLHLRVNPRDFARTYNAAQLATAPVLALSGNSPLFLGHRLWEETRIALFKQSVDDRGDLQAWKSSRASFGHGWIRDGIHELLQEAVALHEPLLPVCSDEDPVVAVRAGKVPRLEELRLHNGTVWTWNRAIYDDAAGGHLRIELRPFAAGPTVRDMMASSALVLGLTLGLAEETAWMLPALPFEHAERNFYQAAKHGLDAELLWPSGTAPSPRRRRVADVVDELLPIAERGLKAGGVDVAEASSLLGVISDRLGKKMTGARWQRAALARFEEKKADRGKALHLMLEQYLELSAGGQPVHTWPLP